jgi:hypothetical protein
MEGKFWKQTLANLAASVGVTGVVASERTVCVDQRTLWKNWRNVFRNGGFATAAHAVATPFHRSQNAG